MYTLPNQFELLSDAWLDEARAFLRTGGRRRRRCRRSRSASASPTHRRTWRCRATWRRGRALGRRALDVSRQPDPAADLVVEGDYQAALTAAAAGRHHARRTRPSTCGARSPSSSARTPSALRGRFADRRVDELLARLHDHLGRRTVENPDLHHRAARQGLAGNIVEMEEQGYTVLEHAISDEFADEIREQTLRVLPSTASAPCNWMLYQGRAFELLAQNPQLMTLDRRVARPRRGHRVVQRDPQGPGPRHDPAAHRLRPRARAVSGVGDDRRRRVGARGLDRGVGTDVDRARAATGCGAARGRARTAEGGVPIEMPKGSVVFFTEGVWHWQGDRTEPGERVTLHWHFNRGILRSLEPKKVDPQMLHRNAPRLGEMLGEDDWFDKMRGIGRDHERFAHMARLHAFTNEQKAALLAASRDHDL